MSRPRPASHATPNDAETAKLVAVNCNGGTSDAARESRARKAQSPIAPHPARVAAETAPKAGA